MDGSPYDASDWRVIPFATDYAVNCEGRVKRIAASPHHRRNRELKARLRQDGYPAYVLYCGGERIDFQAHVIVCRVFHGDKPEDKDEVGHRDGDRANPHASNLRWVTKSENYADRNRHGTHNKGVRNGQAKLNEAGVRLVRELSRAWPSRKVARVMGISKSQVGNILRGEAWAP